MIPHSYQITRNAPCLSTSNYFPSNFLLLYFIFIFFCAVYCTRKLRYMKEIFFFFFFSQFGPYRQNRMYVDYTRIHTYVQNWIFRPFIIHPSNHPSIHSLMYVHTDILLLLTILYFYVHIYMCVYPYIVISALFLLAWKKRYAWLIEKEGDVKEKLGIEN